MEKYIAKARFIPFSPYKLRLLADVVRDKKVFDALKWLNSYRTQRSVPLKKVIESALANMKNLNSNLSDNEIFITNLRVDHGPMRKYMKPGAQGRSSILRRRYCHISVELGSKKNKLKNLNKEESNGTKG